ncbi:hypothetical protein [Stutzerimonas stutzeri]|uniref:Uncharacterized protein n=1 Tax=Stutzerimonas stutzeri TaxID=316 RepID=A0A5S5BJU0_STUST|nr:hypothetical protein [Stutzerimonas stutzeri]TYP67311.1 hypothetical protein A9A72_10217 [Stutzerimonas stutzeri]
MTFEERLFSHECERDRMAETQTILYKWAAGFAASVVGSIGYVGISIQNPTVPMAAVLILFGFLLVCLLKVVELHNEIDRARYRLVHDLLIVAPTGHGKGNPFPERQSSFD